jgi:hypothetical protein
MPLGSPLELGIQDENDRKQGEADHIIGRLLTLFTVYPK